MQWAGWREAGSGLRLTFSIVDVITDLLWADDVGGRVGDVGAEDPGKAVQTHVVLKVLAHARHLCYHRELHATREDNVKVSTEHNGGKPNPDVILYMNLTR